MVISILAFTGVVAAVATKYGMEDEQRRACFSAYVEARTPSIRN